MSITKIEWTDRTWNPVTGCTKVSPGCDNCYAENIAHRFAGSKAFPDGFSVTLHEDRIDQPFRWKKSARVFVNSMSDLFHDDVPDLFITRVFDVMEANARHTFQVLTKRHARMRSFVQAREKARQEHAAKFDQCPTEAMRTSPAARAARARAARPPANIWLGVSVENQQWANIRIPALLETPAAVRFISCEPLLGPVDLKQAVVTMGSERGHGLTASYVHTGGCCQKFHGIDWVIAGGESGPRARPMHPDWARGLRDQCEQARVPFFFKQYGEYLSAAVTDDTEFAGGRAYNDPLNGGRSSATIRELGPSRTFRSGVTRPMRPGDRTRRTWLLDANTIAVRVGKTAAGRLLDGRTHDAFPHDNFRESVQAGFIKTFDDHDKQHTAPDTARRT
ncbi:phage Gp37/Gp68 family protein [Streptomyces sp. NPDC051320]|uniref:DUF5131 family protein n=1 Tax=Streptomyces sp. NPDC051320 TaxID=3154644 RepID=UPI00342E2C1F